MPRLTMIDVELSSASDISKFKGIDLFQNLQSRSIKFTNDLSFDYMNTQDNNELRKAFIVSKDSEENTTVNY